ncbi:MAG: SRPBCC domain-containing protein [Rhodoglobus sp.]
MTTSSMRFERIYEFAPSIVWDALVDADLVSGWLAEASIAPQAGGEFTLRWITRDPPTASVGWITRFEPFAQLEVTGRDSETMLFSLIEVTGGSRGTSTALTLDVASPIEPAFASRTPADWLTSLDHLAGLLRGHPVDWQNLRTNRAAASSAHPGVESDPAETKPRTRRHPHG